MTHVFLSYSHKDGDYAHKLAEELKRQGIEIWIDDRIDYGDRWPRVIQEHLESSQAMVIIMSTNAYNSAWVHNELAFAQHHNKDVFPVLLEGGLWLALSSTQHVDVRDGKLPPESYFKTLKKRLAISVNELEEAILNEAIINQLAPAVNAAQKREWNVGLFRVSYQELVDKAVNTYDFFAILGNESLLRIYDPDVYEDYKRSLGIPPQRSQSMAVLNVRKTTHEWRLNLRLLGRFTSRPTAAEIEDFVKNLIQMHKDHHVPISEIKIQPIE